MSHELWSFLVWSVPTGTFSDSVRVLCAVGCSPRSLQELLLLDLGSLLKQELNCILLDNTRRESCTVLWVSYSVQIFPSWSSVLQSLATLFSLDSQLHHLNSGGAPGSNWLFPPCTKTWKLSPGNKLGQLQGLTLLIFHLLGITELHCLIPTSWKLLLCLFSFNLHFEGKSGPWPEMEVCWAPLNWNNHAVVWTFAFLILVHSSVSKL